VDLPFRDGGREQTTTGFNPHNIFHTIRTETHATRRQKRVRYVAGSGFIHSVPVNVERPPTTVRLNLPDDVSAEFITQSFDFWCLVLRRLRRVRTCTRRAHNENVLHHILTCTPVLTPHTHAGNVTLRKRVYVARYHTGVYVHVVHTVRIQYSDYKLVTFTTSEGLYVARHARR